MRPAIDSSIWRLALGCVEAQWCPMPAAVVASGKATQPPPAGMTWLVWLVETMAREATHGCDLLSYRTVFHGPCRVHQWIRTGTEQGCILRSSATAKCPLTPCTLHNMPQWMRCRARVVVASPSLPCTYNSISRKQAVLEFAAPTSVLSLHHPSFPSACAQYVS